jgi:hypothetical protein
MPSGCRVPDRREVAAGGEWKIARYLDQSFAMPRRTRRSIGSRGGTLLVGRLAPGRAPPAPEATLNDRGNARRAVLTPCPAVPPRVSSLSISWRPSCHDYLPEMDHSRWLVLGAGARGLHFEPLRIGRHPPKEHLVRPRPSRTRWESLSAGSPIAFPASRKGVTAADWQWSSPAT